MLPHSCLHKWLDLSVPTSFSESWSPHVTGSWISCSKPRACSAQCPAWHVHHCSRAWAPSLVSEVHSLADLRSPLLDLQVIASPPNWCAGLLLAFGTHFPTSPPGNHCYCYSWLTWILGWLQVRHKFDLGTEPSLPWDRHKPSCCAKGINVKLQSSLLTTDLWTSEGKLDSEAQWW